MNNSIREKIESGYYSDSNRAPDLRVMLRLHDENAPMSVENLSSDTKISIVTVKDAIIRLQGRFYLDRVKTSSGLKYLLTKLGKDYALTKEEATNSHLMIGKVLEMETTEC